ncbi:MAG: NAD(P)/FAD-dependent oxidoreductase [Chloroflexi bacterium]|nr:NAD(P)/FAD-dependent oxidoreductase [Chloroflexota bacterium]
MKSIIIIGSGMGGLATGIYGQYNGFDTVIFEAHHLPGGQCTSWKRKGYVFDPCIHSLNGFKSQTKVNAFWQELGAMPCEMVERNEFVSAVLPDGTCFHNYFDLEKLESHLKQLSPEDAAVIDEYINGIKSFLKEDDLLGITNFGTLWEKLSIMPFFISKLKYFGYTLGSFAKRFKHPLLCKAFPLIRHSVPDVPLFGYLAEHTSYIYGDTGWPRGGGSTLSKNMAARYLELGGTIHYRKKVVKILTKDNRACGVELEDGTQHTADFVVSNADGRKTILEMLDGQYMNKKVAKYCEPYPEDNDVPSSVLVCLGVKRDLSSYPSALIMFLDQPEIIGGHNCDHLHMQIYGFDTSMAPAGKGVIKVELFGKPSYFSRLCNDKAAYQAEKNKIAEQVITLLENQFPGLGEDIEVVDVSTLQTWERFMGGTQGHNNYPKKYDELTDIRNVLDFMFGLNKMFTLPGLENFFFTGQWVTSMGSLFSNALTGQTVVQKICKQCGVQFTKPS